MAPELASLARWLRYSAEASRLSRRRSARSARRSEVRNVRIFVSMMLLQIGQAPYARRLNPLAERFLSSDRVNRKTDEQHHRGAEEHRADGVGRVVVVPPDERQRSDHGHRDDTDQRKGSASKAP